MPNRCENCTRRSTNIKECRLLELRLQVFEREEIEKDLIQALTLVYRNEGDLLKRGIHERTISFYLMHYFIDLFGDKYYGYNIDPEYNRNGIDSKYYYDVSSSKSSRAIPDIIIHKRNCNKYNLLYLEMKKDFHDDHDCEKIKKFMADCIITHWGGNTKPTIYKFRHGVSIALSSNALSMKWYIKEDDVWLQCKYLYSNKRHMFERME